MIEQLACSAVGKDEGPNVKLAVELAGAGNRKGINEIAQGLLSGEERIANDSIKILYETGERKPALIAGYADMFIRLLGSKNNRMVRGAIRLPIRRTNGSISC